MKIIVPMAGWGSRLRPHTLTIPKPMVPVAGKPIVQRLCEGLVKTVDEEVESIHFVIREEFGTDIEHTLRAVADGLGTTGVIHYQDEPEGTAHAIHCAREALDGRVIVAFADTLFRTDFTIDPSDDGVVWVSQVDDPSAFGVVQLDDHGTITDFVEKPDTFVSDLAIIGIYYFRDGAALGREIRHLIDNDIRGKGDEFQLTDALENLKEKGTAFKPGRVIEWLDCGNKDAVVHTNARVLDHLAGAERPDGSQTITNSVVIEPCYLGPNVVLENAVVGPHVSIGANTTVRNSVVRNSVVQSDTVVEHVVLEGSMVGNKARIEGRPDNLSLGDYSVHR